MVFVFVLNGDGSGKAVLKLILSNPECSTPGEPPLWRAVTCRLCCAQTWLSRGQKEVNKTIILRKREQHLTAAPLLQPSCLSHRSFQGRDCARLTREWRCELSKERQRRLGNGTCTGVPGTLAHAYSSSMQWWLRQETAASLRPTQDTWQIVFFF